MTGRVILICLGLAFLVGTCRAQTSPAQARVAVVGDSESGNLADLVVASLSSETSIKLLERQDMMKIGDELQLQQLADNNAASLGRMLDADGLLFIKKEPSGFNVQLTAVGLGYAVFDDTLAADANSDIPHLAQTIAHRILDYSSKLELKTGTAVAISVLNVRADAVPNNDANLEQKLSLLLESKLAAQPNDVVLERRHAGAILFEKSLAPAGNQSPLEGAYIVDGSFTQSLQGGNDLAVHLRLRTPSHQENPLEIQGSSNDLGALTDQMTAAVQKAIGKPVSPAIWHPANEAREYLLEGIWGWKHDAIDEALQALDSAAMLGETAPDLQAALIHVLSAKAVGSTNIANTYPDTPDDPHPEARIEAFLRALDEVQRFEATEPHPPFQILSDRDMGGMITQYRGTVEKAGASLLVMLDRTQNAEADSIRSKLDTFLHFDPQHGQMPEDFFTTITYLDDIAHSPAEEEAYIRQVIDSLSIPLLFALDGHTQPDDFCARFEPDMNKRHAMYLQFLQELDQDETARPAAYADLAVSSRQLNLDRNDTFQRCADELWNEREKLLADGRLSYFLSELFRSEGMGEITPANSRLLDLLHFLLQNSPGVDGHVAQAWRPELFSDAEAPKFWGEFQALAAKPSLPRGEFFVNDMRTRYVDRWGLPPDKSSPVTNALVVNRFWYPKDVVEAGISELYPVLDASGVWVSLMTGGGNQPIRPLLYHVGIDATQDDPFTAAPAIEPPVTANPANSMVVTTDALYILGSPVYQWDRSVIGRYDLASQQWEQHEVPYSTGLFLAAGHLYLSLRGHGTALESGVASYDEENGTTTLLASSRRRPPQNQFDDRDWYDICNIFTGPGNTPCAEIGFGDTYIISDAHGNWPHMIDSGETHFAQSDGKRTIIYGQRSFANNPPGDVVFMIDPTRNQPELLRGAPAQSLGTKMMGVPSGPPPAPWPPVPPVWPDSPQDTYSFPYYGFRGDDIYAHLDKQSPHNGLFWYRRGRAQPLYIPLEFKLDDDATKAFQKSVSATRAQYPDSPSTGGNMKMGTTGIFFVVDHLGFFFLPYADIDAYLKAHPSGAPIPGP